MSGVSNLADEPAADLPPTVDRDAIERMELAAQLLDESVPVPGTSYKVGLDPIMSILPVGGDAAGAVLSLYVVAEAARLGVSTGTLLRMLLNVGVDAAGGSVPILGTVFDAVWKANKWNVELAIEDLADGAGTTTEREISIDIE